MDELREPLVQMCSAVPGAFAAVVMGFDGLEVDSHRVDFSEDDAPDVESLLIEYSSLIPQVQRSAQMFAAGEFEELAVSSEHLTAILRPINADYFLALTMRPQANFGKGRYLVRLNAPKLAKVLS